MRDTCVGTAVAAATAAAAAAATDTRPNTTRRHIIDLAYHCFNLFKIQALPRRPTSGNFQDALPPHGGSSASCIADALQAQSVLKAR